MINQEDDRITAGELRDFGFELDERIPDCASVLRRSLRFGDPEIKLLSDDQFNISLKCKVDEPFEWFNIKFTIPKP